MKMLITGSNGLLGQRLSAIAIERGHSIWRTDIDEPANQENYVQLDLTDQDGLLSVCERFRPEAIINCAAITDVDLCERDKDLASSVNSEVPLHLSESSNIIGAHMIQISTDYVFDGRKGLYSEEDEQRPINHYGFSKLQGEMHVKSTARSWSIARTSVVFGWGREKRPNFATWVIKGLRNRNNLNVVIDQFASPTLNTNLAEMLLELAERRLQGVHHLAGKDRTDRFSMAVKIADEFGLDKTLLTPASSDGIRWLARRPKDSSLNVRKAVAELKSVPMGLERALREMRLTENK